jgi:hypothetical protein
MCCEHWIERGEEKRFTFLWGSWNPTSHHTITKLLHYKKHMYNTEKSIMSSMPVSSCSCTYRDCILICSGSLYLLTISLADQQMYLYLCELHNLYYKISLVPDHELFSICLKEVQLLLITCDCSQLFNICVTVFPTVQYLCYGVPNCSLPAWQCSQLFSICVTVFPTVQYLCDSVPNCSVSVWQRTQLFSICVTVFPIVQYLCDSVPNCSVSVWQCSQLFSICVTVRHVTGNDQDYLRKIPRVVVQKSALL